MHFILKKFPLLALMPLHQMMAAIKTPQDLYNMHHLAANTEGPKFPKEVQSISNKCIF